MAAWEVQIEGADAAAEEHVAVVMETVAPYSAVVTAKAGILSVRMTVQAENVRDAITTALDILDGLTVELNWSLIRVSTASHGEGIVF